MSKERGMYNMDFMPMFIGMAVVAGIAGFAAYPLFGWLWGIIKPWLHLGVDFLSTEFFLKAIRARGESK